MHFQIYIPKAKDLAAELATVGLPEFVTNAEVMRCEDGPDGQGGAVFAWWIGGPHSRQIGYRPDQQTWYPSRCEKFWSGLWNDSPPTPAELILAANPGKRVRLGSAEWLVPAADRAERELMIQPNGTQSFRTPKRYEPLILSTLQWAERLRAEPRFVLTDEVYAEFLDIAVGALKLNYRITREVALAAGLFTTRNLLEAFGVVTGIPLESPE